MSAFDETAMAHTLLLADASVTIQRVIQLTFANEDIAVVAVNDGGEAIECLRHSPPDIVLADSGMPGVSGYDVARHIKSTPGLAHIPVLLLAGAFESVDPDRLAASGCDGVLSKPFEPQAVVQRVKELLAHEGSAGADRRVPVADNEVPAEPPMFADVVDEGPLVAAESQIENPAEMSEGLASPPPAVEPPLEQAVDRGFEAAEPVPAESPKAGRPAQLDDYFDELDRAIAARVSEQAKAPVTNVPAATESTSTMASTPSSAPTPSVAPAPPSEPPMLADAFSALLAAEESATADPVTAIQSLLPPAPAVEPPAPAPPPTIVVSEEIVEKVVRRVLEEMTGQALRDTVAEVTASTAERLVLEEIARIKSNIP